MAERPDPVGGVAGRAIGDAGLAQMAIGGGEAAFDIGRRQPGKGIEEARPDRPRRAVLCNIFIGNAGQPDIVASPLRHPALAGTGPALLTAALTASLATRCGHCTSPAAN